MEWFGLTYYAYDQLTVEFFYLISVLPAVCQDFISYMWIPDVSEEHATAILTFGEFNQGGLGLLHGTSSRHSEQTPASVSPVPRHRLSESIATCRNYAVIHCLLGTSRKPSVLTRFSLSYTLHWLH